MALWRSSVRSRLAPPLDSTFGFVCKPTVFSASPSSRGPGHRPFTAVTGVRIPLGTPYTLPSDSEEGRKTPVNPGFFRFRPTIHAEAFRRNMPPRLQIPFQRQRKTVCVRRLSGREPQGGTRRGAEAGRTIATKIAQIGADSFEAIAREWLEQTEAKRVVTTNDTIKSCLEADLLPCLGKRPISDIKAPEPLAALRRVEARGSLIVAKRLRQIAEQIIRLRRRD